MDMKSNIIWNIKSQIRKEIQENQAKFVNTKQDFSFWDQYLKNT